MLLDIPSLMLLDIPSLVVPEGHVSSNYDQSSIYTPGACNNVEHVTLSPSSTGAVLAPFVASPSRSVTQWPSLFTKLPKNAGVHSPCSFENVEIDGMMILPVEVIEAGVDY